MTHLLDDNHTNGVHVAPTYPHTRFKTVLRIPREHRYAPPPPRQPMHVEMVDNLSPALLLGCLVVSAAAVSVIGWAAFEVGRSLFDLVRHWGGI